MRFVTFASVLVASAGSSYFHRFGRQSGPSRALGVRTPSPDARASWQSEPTVASPPTTAAEVLELFWQLTSEVRSSTAKRRESLRIAVQHTDAMNVPLLLEYMNSCAELAADNCVVTSSLSTHEVEGCSI